MKLAFITTNRHKVKEAQDVLDNFGISLEQVDIDYEENHDDSIEDIAKEAAKKLAKQLNCPVIVEDTGVFFEAYSNFPGALPKFAFNAIGYKGFFKLLEGENRKAYFKSVIGYCEPNNEPITFEGKMNGVITESVFDEEKDCLPYERIFIPDNYTITTSKMSVSEKNKISHRGKAFRELGQYLSKGKNGN